MVWLKSMEGRGTGVQTMIVSSVRGLLEALCDGLSRRWDAGELNESASSDLDPFLPAICLPRLG